MKRVKAACICQTLHFTPKEEMSPQSAERIVREEYEHYKRGLDSNHTQYKIVEELPQSDGSLMVKVIKAYNYSPVGDYLD